MAGDNRPVSGSPPSSTAFIYRTQEGYRHVHVHPKPYRAYKITRNRNTFCFHALEKRRIEPANRRFSAGKNRDVEDRFDGSASERELVQLPFLTLLFPFVSHSFVCSLASLTIAYYTDNRVSRARINYCFREKHHDQSNELDYRRACIKIIPYLPAASSIGAPSSRFLRLSPEFLAFTLIDWNTSFSARFSDFFFVRYIFIDHPAFPEFQIQSLEIFSISLDRRRGRQWNVQARKCICLLSLLNESRMCADACLEGCLLYEEMRLRKSTKPLDFLQEE